MRIKRNVVLTVVLTMLWLSVFPLINGCKNSADMSGENYYTITEWLDRVENVFSMDYYVEEEPLIQTVMRDNENFDIIQVAAEWGLISAEQELDFDSRLTKELCADTLMTATNFDSDASVEIDDASKVNPTYLDNVEAAVDKGFLSLDGGKFKPDQKMTKDEADTALLMAYDQWINFSFEGECFDKSVVYDNVINLGGLSDEVTPAEPITLSDYHIDYSGDTNFFTNGDFQDNTIKTITFAKDSAPSMEAGSVLSFPADDFMPQSYAVVVDSIIENNDGTITVNTHNAQPEDVYEVYEARQSGDIDFSKAAFYTPNGQKIEWSDNITETEELAYIPDNTYGVYDYKDGVYTLIGYKSGTVLNNEVRAEKLNASASGGATVDLGGGVKLTLSKKLSSGSSELTAKMSFKKEDKTKGTSVTFEFTNVLKMTLDSDVKVSWWLPFKLDRAYLKLGQTQTSSFKVIVKAQEGDSNDLKKSDLESVYNELVKIMNTGKYSGQAVGAAVSKDLVNIALGNGFHFKLRINVSLEGEIELKTVITNNVGFEYTKKDKMRAIKESSIKPEIALNAKLEVTLGAALTWDVLGKTVADLELAAGPGVKLSSKIYEYNEATGALNAECALTGLYVANATGSATLGNVSMGMAHMLSQDDLRSCTELKIYTVVKLTLCTNKSLIGKYIWSAELDLSDIFPSKTWHWESDMGAVDACTRGVDAGYDIKTGEELILSPPGLKKMVIAVGEENTSLKIDTLPKGVKVEDVKLAIEDKSVLSAENLMTSAGKNPEEKKAAFKISSKITGTDISSTVYYKENSPDDKEQFKLVGLSDGVTKLTITAGSYSKTIDVIVGNGGIELVSEGRFVIDNTTMNLSAGEKSRITVVSAPEGYDLSQVTFTSDNTSIVSVDAFGNITAKDKTGSAIVSVSTNDGKYSAICLVNVLAN